MKEEYTKAVTLTFIRSELLFDVQSYAYVEADTMDEARVHSQHQTFDIAEDGNRELCSRIISLVLAKCTELLYPFSKKSVEDTEVRTDQLAEPERYTIGLLVPDSFSKTTADYLEQLIHNLIVWRILANWLATTKPEAAAAWAKKADEVEGEILSAKSIRMKKVRRKISPF